MYRIEIEITGVEIPEPIVVDAVRDTAYDVKCVGKELIMSSLAALGLKKCECFISLTISKGEEYYDSDESFATVDVENKTIFMGGEEEWQL